MLQLIIHMFHASLIPCISLDQYLNPNLYTIPNMQNMRFFCCSVYLHNSRLISVVDVVITPMNPYQPIPFHILSFAVFQSRILNYASSPSDEIAEEEKVFERKDRLSLKNININTIKNIYMNKIISHQTL